MPLVRFSICAWPLLLACWLMSVVACGYEDRDFDQVAFACDPSHPCPDGRACIVGRCAIGNGGGSGSGSADAGNGSNTGKLGVQCGTAFCPSGMGCCNDLINPLRCVQRGGCDTGAQQEVECDGAEDCGLFPCCLNGGGTKCGTSATCDELVVCTNDSNCPPSMASCCAFPVLGFPLRTCQPGPC